MEKGKHNNSIIMEQAVVVQGNFQLKKKCSKQRTRKNTNDVFDKPKYVSNNNNTFWQVLFCLWDDGYILEELKRDKKWQVSMLH